MKVRIIKANGVKEADQIFDLDFLQKFVDKANLGPILSHTGNYVTTGGDPTTTTTGGITYTDSSATSVVDFAKLYSSTS
jgi:hypothetical protein